MSCYVLFTSTDSYDYEWNFLYVRMRDILENDRTVFKSDFLMLSRRMRYRVKTYVHCLVSTVEVWTSTGKGIVRSHSSFAFPRRKFSFSDFHYISCLSCDFYKEERRLMREVEEATARVAASSEELRCRREELVIAEEDVALAKQLSE